MGEITTIGLDLAKHVFQVHGVDAEGATVLRKQLAAGAGAGVLQSSCRAAWWEWRRVRRRTTGRGSCARSAMRCD